MDMERVVRFYEQVPLMETHTWLWERGITSFLGKLDEGRVASWDNILSEEITGYVEGSKTWNRNDRRLR